MKSNVTMKSSYIAGEKAISKTNGLIAATKKSKFHTPKTVVDDSYANSKFS